MKVFISWSGENTASHKIAIVLRDWLRCVINTIVPFVSSEDIQSGERGLIKIQEQLKDSDFGIVCVTKENYQAPWLLFEAGALSNNPNKVPVVPFLFGLKPSDLKGSPLIQFYAAIYSGKESIRKLIQSLNTTCRERALPDSILDRSFEKWYPGLEASLLSIGDKMGMIEDAPRGDIDKNQAIEEEILEITRNIQKKLLSEGAILFENRIERDFIKKPYKFTVEIETTTPGIFRQKHIGIRQETSLADVLDRIFRLLHGKVRAFTYLVHWILQEKDSGRELVVSNVKHDIPAHTLLKKNSVWQVKFLDKPYVPTIAANERWYEE